MVAAPARASVSGRVAGEVGPEAHDEWLGPVPHAQLAGEVPHQAKPRLAPGEVRPGRLRP
eukprot:4679043-Alexandrium_andersonii.AAC.1